VTGAELQRRRLAVNLSQEQLAERVGFTGKWRAMHISNYETGKRQINARLAKTFEMLFASLENGA